MKGVRVEVAFGEYVVPPISLRVDYDHQAEIDIIATSSIKKDWNEAAVKFILAVLRSSGPGGVGNYPDLTDEEFFMTVSSADLPALLIAAKNQSGYAAAPLDGRPSASPAEISSVSSSTPPAGSPTTSSTGSPGPT